MGRGVPSGGSPCFVFPLRAGLRLFLCIELLMRIFFFAFELLILSIILSVFLFTMLNFG